MAYASAQLFIFQIFHMTLFFFCLFYSPTLCHPADSHIFVLLLLLLLLFWFDLPPTSFLVLMLFFTSLFLFPLTITFNPTILFLRQKKGWSDMTLNIELALHFACFYLNQLCSLKDFFMLWINRCSSHLILTDRQINNTIKM